MKKQIEEVSEEELLHEAITLCKRHEYITRFQLSRRMALSSHKADSIYNRLRLRGVISYEEYKDTPTGKLLVGVIDKKALYDLLPH